MQIKVNGETDRFPENSTIRDILSARELPEEIVIVFLNGEMVRSESWNNVLVSADDRLEIIKVVGGG
jgi:thiamine biosynthesis protein ThiS